MSRNQKPDLPADELAFYDQPMSGDEFYLQRDLIDEFNRIRRLMSVWRLTARNLYRNSVMAQALRDEREGGYRGTMQEHRQMMANMRDWLQGYLTIRADINREMSALEQYLNSVEGFLEKHPRYARHGQGLIQSMAGIDDGIEENVDFVAQQLNNLQQWVTYRERVVSGEDVDWSSPQRIRRPLHYPNDFLTTPQGGRFLGDPTPSPSPPSSPERVAGPTGYDFTSGGTSHSPVVALSPIGPQLGTPVRTTPRRQRVANLLAQPARPRARPSHEITSTPQRRVAYSGIVRRSLSSQMASASTPLLEQSPESVEFRNRPISQTASYAPRVVRARTRRGGTEGQSLDFSSLDQSAAEFGVRPLAELEQQHEQLEINEAAGATNIPGGSNVPSPRGRYPRGTMRRQVFDLSGKNFEPQPLKDREIYLSDLLIANRQRYGLPSHQRPFNSHQCRRTLETQRIGTSPQTWGRNQFYRSPDNRTSESGFVTPIRRQPFKGNNWRNNREAPKRSLWTRLLAKVKAILTSIRRTFDYYRLLWGFSSELIENIPNYEKTWELSRWSNPCSQCGECPQYPHYLFADESETEESFSEESEDYLTDGDIRKLL